MTSARTARILPIALILIIAALSIAALLSVARVIFFPNSTTNNSQADSSRSSLVNIDAGRAVQMTVRGPIVSNEEFRSYSILVTPEQRVFNTYQGYLDQVLYTETLANNTAAYTEFVNAIDKAGMMNGTELKGDSNKTSGVCAAGYVYEFSIIKDNKTTKQLWTSSCSSSRGSLGVKSTPIRTLFTKQIPDAKTIIDKLW